MEFTNIDRSRIKETEICCGFPYSKQEDRRGNDRYPILKITDISGEVGTCIYFTKLGFARGFHEIGMEPEDVQKTTIKVEVGRYEY